MHTQKQNIYLFRLSENSKFVLRTRWTFSIRNQKNYAASYLYCQGLFALLYIFIYQQKLCMDNWSLWIFESGKLSRQQCKRPHSRQISSVYSFLLYRQNSVNPFESGKFAHIRNINVCQVVVIFIGHDTSRKRL